MNHQSNWRNQQSRTSKTKEVLKVAFILAICFWLFYQIKHSYSDRKRHGISTHSQLMEEHSASTLGRKVNAGCAGNEGEMDTEVVNLLEEKEKKEDEGAGDNELDGHQEQTNEEPFYLKENKDTATHEGLVESELEKGYREVQKNKDKIPDIQVIEGVETISTKVDDNFSEASENVVRSVGNEHDVGKEVKETSSQEVFGIEMYFNGSLLRDEDEAAAKNIEDKDAPETEAKIDSLPGVLFNNNVSDQSEVDPKVHGFLDENGVPLDLDVVLKSRQTEFGEGEKNIIIQDSALSSSNEIRIVEDTQTEDKDVESKEGRVAAQGRRDRGTSNISSDVKINAEPSKASNLKEAAYAGGRKTMRQSRSFSSEQELEAISGGGMLTKAE